MEFSSPRTVQLASLNFQGTGHLTRAPSDQEIDTFIDEILGRTEISESTQKLHTLELLSKAEQKTEACKIKMDEICEWLYLQFMNPSNNPNITSKEALSNIKDEFPNPCTDIPTFFNNREQSGYFQDFNADKDGNGFFEELVDEEEFYNNIEGNIYEIIYEIVFEMIYIETVFDSYPMIYFPLTWTHEWSRDFLRCFKYLELQSNINEEEEDKMEEKKQDIESIEKRKRFLNQFRLKYKGTKTFKELNDKTCKCCGCRKRIDDGYSKNKQYEIWRRIPFINDDIDKYEFVFHDKACVLLRKYKEAIRQYIFEYELVNKRSQNIKRDKQGNIIIPELTDDERLFYLYRDRNYILAVDSGKSKDELPQPSLQIERSFHSKTNIKNINIFMRRKRRLAAYYLYKQYDNENNNNNNNIDKKEKIYKLEFTNHELLQFIDVQIYGIALWRFCVTQLEIKNRPGLWQIMNHLACHLATLSILKELEDSKDSFKRFEVHSLNVLCQTVIQNAQFPAATALYLAAFMSLRGLEDESRKDEFNSVRELFVDIAKELLNKIESDHLLAIRLELPTDINYLTILDIGLKFELDDFLEFHRLQPIFIQMWREFEYLNPSQPFYTKDAGFYQAFILLLFNPNKFYYTPLGLFIIDFVFYIMYLLVFTWFIYFDTYPYQSPTLNECILWIFNGGFIMYELQEMVFRKGEYFADLVNYWDIFISLNWIALFCMRIYCSYYQSDWIIYFDTTPPIIDEISTRSTDFFVIYTCLMAIQCVLLWTRLLSKLQRSNFLAPLIQMILDMLTDVFKFCILLAIFVIAFVFALNYVIAGDLHYHKRLKEAEILRAKYPSEIYFEDNDQIQENNEYVPPLDSPSSIFLYVAQTLLGQQDWGLIASDQPDFGLVFFDEQRARVVDAFILLFSILGTILLLNLLIALMASTYERVRSLSYIRVNFFKSLNTYEIVNRVALMPPPLNILVLTIVLIWIITEIFIELITCFTFTFSSQRLNPLKYSLRDKKRILFMSKKDIKEESQSLLTNDTDNDIVDGRWIHYNNDNIIDNIYDNKNENNIYNNNIYTITPKRTADSFFDSNENDKFQDVEKYFCFEKLPKGTCHKFFCCTASKNSRRYCRFCRNDMRNATTGNIDEYFNLFRFHGQIIDESDINLMRELCSDKNYVHLCPHCFRPYILWKGNTKYENDSNRRSRWQIMLEIISFYVFILIVYIPLSIFMSLPAIWSIIYIKCVQISKPRAFTGDDILADIQLESKISKKNVKHVNKVIKNSQYKFVNLPRQIEKEKSQQVEK